MATQNNLKLLEMDEPNRKTIEEILSRQLDACRVLNLTLDIASSDVVFFVENQQGENLCIG